MPMPGRKRRAYPSDLTNIETLITIAASATLLRRWL
jgi:hypothetical protein